jgi:hypothetical protein
MNPESQELQKMIAVFFKNQPASTSKDDLQKQGENAMQERMIRLMREQARIAWASPPAKPQASLGVKRASLRRRHVAVMC